MKMLTFLATATAVSALPSLFKHQAFPSNDGVYYVNGLSPLTAQNAGLHFMPFTTLTSAPIATPPRFQNLIAHCSYLAPTIFWHVFSLTAHNGFSVTNGTYAHASDYVWSYNTDTREWLSLLPLPSNPRSVFSYTVASQNTLHTFSRLSAQEINPYTGLQTPFTLTTPIPESGCSVQVNETTTLIFGGVVNGTIVSTLLQVVDGNVTRSDAVSVAGASCAHVNGIVYLFGGHDGANYTNAMYAYDVQTRVLTPLTPARLPTERMFASLTAVGTLLVLNGGLSSNGGIGEGFDFFDTCTGLWSRETPLPLNPAGKCASNFVVNEQPIESLATKEEGKRALVGGIIGGVVFVVLLVGISVYLRKRGHGNASHQEMLVKNTVVKDEETVNAPLGSTKEVRDEL